MSNKFIGIDYDENAETTKKLDQFLNKRLREILLSQVSTDHFDYIKLITAKDYNY